MIAALALMCALSAAECRSIDARRLATAIDAAAADDGLRAVLVVYARGPLQLWGAAGDLPLDQQCRAWLANVQASSLALVSGYGRAGRRIAARRAREAAELLERAR